MNFGLGDMNTYTRDDVYVHLLTPINEGRPVKIFTDNSVETIDFGNTKIPFKSKLSPHRRRGGKG